MLWSRSQCRRLVTLFRGRFSASCSFSSSFCLNARKKKSQYGDVDTEQYSSLVKSVVSVKASSQTPGSILTEDERLFGSVVKSKAQVSEQVKKPWPLFNEAKSSISPEPQNQNLSRINLQRGSNESRVASVTRILQNTMSAQQLFYLQRWRRRKISELGEEGFKEYTTKMFTQGKLFHAAIDDVLTSGKSLKEAECEEQVSGYLQSISHVLDSITGVKAIESVVRHESLKYLGIVDCVATYKDTLCIIDWKTSEKPKPLLDNTYDNPLQIAAYIGALNSDDNYNYQVENGLIVVAYKDGSPAHSHFLYTDQVETYWERWLLRLEKYMEKDIQQT